jgi:hypothetical protein
MRAASLWPCVLLCLADAATTTTTATTTAAAVVHWWSSPTYANETLVIAGANLMAQASAALTSPLSSPSR